MDRRDAAASREAPPASRPQVRVLGKYYAPFEGGIEHVTRIAAEALVGQYDVEVMAFAHDGGDSEEPIKGVRVRRFATQAVIASQPISLGYALAVLRGHYDLLIFHAPNILANLALLIRRVVLGDRARLIVVHHMDMHGRKMLRAPSRWLYDRLLTRADCVVVTSLKNAHVSSDIRVACTTEAIPLGIDPADYEVTDQARAIALQRRRALAGDAPLVGFVGRHARYKGLDVLMRALALLPGVHAIVAGEGCEGGAARTLARELDIAERVHFIGRVSHDEKLGLLATIDVFAFPSTEITEAFGIAQLEAMIVGAPVVASDLPTGVSDISIDGQTALTVPPGDAAALAAGLARTIAQPAEARRRAGTARQYVIDRFTTARMAAAYRQLVKAALEL
jgi:glycosyltransferase involved in cell wall biosynthesis